jgi:hypothetical protein
LFPASAHTFVNITGTRAGTTALIFPGCLTRWLATVQFQRHIDVLPKGYSHLVKCDKKKVPK